MIHLDVLQGSIEWQDARLGIPTASRFKDILTPKTLKPSAQSKGYLHELVAETLQFIDAHGAMTLAQFRDHFGTSRKYAQAALEHLDRLKYTRRVGDDRVRGPRRPSSAATTSTEGH